ncbi:MAG TPA: serine/threonine protein phosphatase, partial [Cyclobacteriaceae bacterium]|nr:serine/threonine protein phosphatase [Cyclobacteriaceae bacterium]
MRTKAIIRLLFLGSVIFWLTLLFTDVSVLFSAANNIPPGIPVWLPKLSLNLFILSVFYYYRYRIERDENLNFVDLLWKVFATGLIATVISLIFRLFMFFLDSSPLKGNLLVIDFMYLLNLGLLVGFILCAFSVWKRLILYQKSKFLMRVWRIFEITLLLSLIYNTLDLPLPSWLQTSVLVFLLLLSLFLAGNMKWVAYLNFRQKWTSLLLLLLSFFYLGYYYYTVQISADTLAIMTPAFADFRDHILIGAVMVFILIYGVFSFLVILFNLPTTSVFEQKLEEVVNFQRISQSIQTEQSEESVYNILIDSSVSTVFADAAWLEISAENNDHKFYTYKITDKEAHEIREELDKKG